VATFTKFDQFVQDVASGVHQLQTGTSHVLKVMLTLSAPIASNTVRANLTEIASGNGYTTGGATIGTITGAQTSGTFKIVGSADPAWTATPAAMANFRYAVLYNDTPTSPADPLIGFWDYGATLTLGIGETFTVDLDGSNGIFTLA
jgi:hypothetical protein